MDTQQQREENIDIVQPLVNSNLSNYILEFYNKLHAFDIRLSKQIYETSVHYKSILYASKAIELFSNTLALPAFIYLYVTTKQASPITFIAIIILTILFSEFLLKGIFKRERPAWTGATGYAFPSSHSIVSGICIIASISFPLPIMIACIILGLLIPLSRVMRGYHYTIDILIGFSIGLFCGLLWKFGGTGLMLP